MKRVVSDLVNLKGKVVILRVDFNVPVDNKGRILDLNRVNQSLPTIQYLIKQGAKVVIISHLGRPKGFEIRLSLWQIALVLMKKLDAKVYFNNKVIGEEVKEQIKSMGNGSVLLLENVRFYKEETENDKKFSQEIASLGDVFVNDAFGCSHRKHASVYGVARLLPNAIGFLMEKELHELSTAMDSPKHPFVAVIGGAKVPDKIKLLRKFVDKADIILIGGAMAYTFMLAQGHPVGESLVYMDCVKVARELLDYAKAKGKKIVLPIDHVAIHKDDKKQHKFVTEELIDDMQGMDIGPRTVELYGYVIEEAKQIFWNGPVGRYEDENFRKGTLKIAKAIAESKAYSLVGGGDSASAIKLCGVQDKINFISTGGGASLEFIEDGTLACLEVIQEKL